MKINNINIKRVIEKFVGEPEKEMTYDKDFKYLRKITDEKKILEALRVLKEQGIIREVGRVGRPSKIDAGKRKYYSIVQDVRTFEKLLPVYLKENTETFLKSNFVNNLINMHGFVSVFDVVQSQLERSDFRVLATSSLLNLPATTEDYNKFSINLKEELLKVNTETADKNLQANRDWHYIASKIGHEWSPRSYTHIELLSKFNPLEAVRLYRRTIFEHLRSLYLELEKRSFIRRGLSNFMIYDAYLSPFTSYPIFSPETLIFARPFERIFDDTYLIDGDALIFMIERAYYIYDNFADIMFELFKNNPLNPIERYVETKAFIFHWNVASTRFDGVCNLLNELYQKETGSGNYHLRTNGIIFQVIDLETNSNILPPEIAWGTLGAGSIPHVFEQLEVKDGYEFVNLPAKVMEEPFTHLRPCLTFKMLGGRSDLIPIEEILQAIEQQVGGI